jgi:hypothetical protein
LSAEGKRHTVQPYGFDVTLGMAAADMEWLYISLPRAVYYFQMPNDIVTSESKIREINLNSLVPNQVYDSRIIHNFVSREGDNVFAYTIYQVYDIDMSQQNEVVTETTYTLGKSIHIGKITRYTIHTKLNMSTGTYEHKINESPNTGTLDSFGNFIPYDRYGPDTGKNGTWAILLSMGGSAPGQWSATAGIGFYPSTTQEFAEVRDGRHGFNPEAIWRESYEGDWLYAYRNFVWSSTASANLTSTGSGSYNREDTDVMRFLNLSYKNGFFWDHLDSRLHDESYPIYQFRPNTPSTFKRKETVGSAWEGNTPLTGTWQDIQYMYSFTDSASDILWSDYFDGSVPNVPGDYSSWRSWTLAGEQWNGLPHIASIYERSYTLPDFSLAENVLETGNKFGDRLSYPRTWFNFVPLDSIRIISYEITTETISGIDQQIVTLVIESRGYTFYAGDLIQITEDAAIDGAYIIYQVNSNTQFKVTLPGSTNTAGPVASTGIAAKLPPLPEVE